MLPCQPKINDASAETTPALSLAFVDTVVTPPPRGERISREKLIALRRARAWSQPRLAFEAKLSIGTIKRWESRGESSPTLDFESIQALASAFRMTPEALMQQIAVPTDAPADPVADIVAETADWSDAKVEAELAAAMKRGDYDRVVALGDVLRKRHPVGLKVAKAAKPGPKGNQR
jgi:transcriptional regulator with XRE-family HTH domain